jgi:hypothetical protein
VLVQAIFQPVSITLDHSQADRSIRDNPMLKEYRRGLDIPLDAFQSLPRFLVAAAL